MPPPAPPLQDLVGGLPIGVYRTTPDGRVVFANQRLLAMLGYRRFDELAERDLERGDGGADYPRAEFRERLERDGEIRGLECRWKRRDGTELWVRENARLVRGADGAPRYYEGTVEDLSERRRAEEALRRSEARFRTVLDNSLDAFLATDGEGTLLLFNGAAEAAFEKGAAELLGSSLFDHVHPEDAGRLRAALDAALQRPGAPERLHLRVPGAGGTCRELEAIGRALEEPSGDLRLVISARDVTRQVVAEETIRRSAETVRAIFLTSPLAVIGLDPEGRVTMWNPAAERLFGWSAEEAVGSPFRVVPEERRDEHAALRARVMSGEELLGEEVERVRKDGSRITIRIWSAPLRDRGGAVVGLVAFLDDLSEEKRAREALLQAQKLESLGALAGGIAHDFNNLLGVIVGQLALGESRLAADHPSRGHLTKAGEAARLAGELTRKMLAFAGRARFRMEPLDPGALVEGSRASLTAALPDRVVLRTEAAAGLPALSGDADQLRQALRALVLNAAEAIGDRPGAISIRAARRPVGPGDEGAWRHSGTSLPPGEYVAVEVRDDGSGMDAETLARAFEPFFSTRFTGRGLGLPAVLGIARAHGGGVAVESAPGAGTRVELVLPIASRPEPEASRPAGVRRRVLVVEDDPLMREAIEEMLASEGYAVDAVASGGAALRVLREGPGAVGAVVLDLALPDVAGEELFERLRALDPGLPVLISTGYALEDVKRSFEGKTVAGFLQKPFTLDALAAALRRCLE